jgi:hypothetical protein
MSQLDRLPPEEPRKEELVDGGRKRRRAGVDAGRIAAQCDDHRHPFSPRSHVAPVGRADLVPLPVHGERVAIEHLDPVQADIADAAHWVGGDHHRQGDVPAAVPRPSGEEWNVVEVHFGVALHQLLARRATALHPGRELADFGQLREHGELSEESLGHLEVQHLGDPPADIVQALGAECQTHPAHRAEEVDGDGLGTPAAILQQDMIEEEGGPSPWALHDPVGDLRQLQSRAHRMGHAD